MFFNTLAASSLLVAVAFAGPEPVPYKLTGSMSINPLLGLARRQTDGYQPTQELCGPGANCAESCGKNYITCDSTDDTLHCYDPTVLKEKCCPDGSGNSCSDGYFCTSDSVGGTWCCPDGMSLAACAAMYSITGALVSQGPAATTAAPQASSSSIAAPVTSAPAAVTYSSSAAPYYPKSTSTVYVTSCANSTTTSTKPTSTKPAVFTGAANANTVLGGLLALGVAGVVAAL